MTQFHWMILHCPDVFLRIVVAWINFRRAFVILQGRPQSRLLVQRNPEFIEVHRIPRVLIGKPLIGSCCLPVVLARHVKIGKLLFGQTRLHHDDRRLRRRLRRRLCLRLHRTVYYGRTGSLNESLSCGGHRKSAKENDCWKRHSDPDHGESPFSGLGLALSGSFFLPPKIPKIFDKGFFFFSPDSAEGSAGPWPVAPGGRLGSYDVTGFPFASTCGALGSPPPKTRDRTEPAELKRLRPPWT